MSNKKTEQLGMNPSTAANRLVKDLLWNFVETTGQTACCKCGEPMSRETFSIEHVTPWLDSEDPVGLYFDLNNISYSHRSCNVADGRKPTKKYNSQEEINRAKRRYDPLRTYCPEKRREQYKRHGR